MITATQAISGLAAYQLPTVQAARAMLSNTLQCRNIFGLYRQFFPREYRLSKSPSSVAEAIRHREREIEFYRLVAQRLFPLDEDMIEEWLMSDMGEYIPLALMGFDLTDDDLEDVKLPVHVLLKIHRGYALDDTIRAEIGLHTPQVRDFAFQTHHIDVRRLRRLCKEAGIANVLRTLWAVNGDTGNIWLDMTPESMEAYAMPEWDAPTIQFLTQEWRKARKLLDETANTLEQLDHDPSPLALMIEFWNRSITQRRKKLG